MACDSMDPQCTYNMMKVPWVIQYNSQDLNRNLYYIDNQLNKVYLKDYIQKEEVDDYKIGVYYKT